jgi:2-oxoisovalerate dehydrogenase E2 component (dihydrolipoyl transacylase)
MRRVAEAARAQQRPSARLSSSTITITSLGKLGGIARRSSAHPGSHHRRQPRRRAAAGHRRHHCHPPDDDLSSSFDHRFVDGYDAAAMIQALKECGHPATIFMDA